MLLLRCPPEIVEIVVEFSVLDSTCMGATLALVSRLFCQLAIRHLYKDVSIRSRQAFELLLRTAASQSGPRLLGHTCHLSLDWSLSWSPLEPGIVTSSELDSLLSSCSPFSLRTLSLFPTGKESGAGALQNRAIYSLHGLQELRATAEYEDFTCTPRGWARLEKVWLLIRSWDLGKLSRSHRFLYAVFGGGMPNIREFTVAFRHLDDVDVDFLTNFLRVADEAVLHAGYLGYEEEHEDLVQRRLLIRVVGLGGKKGITDAEKRAAERIELHVADLDLAGLSVKVMLIDKTHVAGC